MQCNRWVKYFGSIPEREACRAEDRGPKGQEGWGGVLREGMFPYCAVRGLGERCNVPHWGPGPLPWRTVDLVHFKALESTFLCSFWLTVCKTVRPVLSVHSPVCLSVTLMYYGQTVGWIKMKLGMEVGPGHLVLDEDRAPLSQKGQSPHPQFWPMSLVAKWLDESRCHFLRR